MRISEPSPNGVNGFRMLFDEIEQLQPSLDEQVRVGHAARHVVIGMAREHEEVGRRQHGDGHADVGEPPGDLLLACRRQAGELGHMAHGDAAAELRAFGQVCDEVRIQAGRVVAGIDVHIDVDVEAPRQLEDAVDLPGMIDVVVGRARRSPCAHFQALDQRGIGRGRVRQALLREDADLEIDRPGVFLRRAAAAPRRLSRRRARRSRRACGCASRRA